MRACVRACVRACGVRGSVRRKLLSSQSGRHVSPSVVLIARVRVGSAQSVFTGDINDPDLPRVHHYLNNDLAHPTLDENSGRSPSLARGRCALLSMSMGHG